MLHTMQLLDKALELEPAPFWHRELKLSRNALHNARMRGHISPAIAGALAEKIGEDVDKWIVVAAMESEKDSACKDRMLRRLRTVAKSLLYRTKKRAKHRPFRRISGMIRR